MAVSLRLERCGCKNRPFYRIVAVDSKSPRDGEHLQVLGFYNPLAVVAQPFDPVRNILEGRVAVFTTNGGNGEQTWTKCKHVF